MTLCKNPKNTRFHSYVYAFVATCLIHWQNLPATSTGKQLRRTFYTELWTQAYSDTELGIAFRLLYHGFEGGVCETLTRRKNVDKNIQPVGTPEFD
jgi:hypothetical protein